MMIMKDDFEEARADGGRRFQRKGPANEKGKRLPIQVSVYETDLPKSRY